MLVLACAARLSKFVAFSNTDVQREQQLLLDILSMLLILSLQVKANGPWPLHLCLHDLEQREVIQDARLEHQNEIGDGHVNRAFARPFFATCATDRTVALAMDSKGR